MTERARHILVVANETIAGRSLIEALRRRADEGPIQVTVICPQNTPKAGLVVYADARYSSAERRLERTLDLLHEEGITARGAVVDPDPLQATKDGVHEYRPDEIIVSTHPEIRSGWLRGNLIDRARKVAGAIPVEHVVVDLEEEREKAHVLVVANQTVVGAPLLEAICERAQESPAEFTLVGPADEPGVERRLNRALAQLHERGVEASAHLGHPDPYTAIMTSVHDERIDEIIVSTFHEASSGWLRRDLIGRVKKDAGVPVQHVVVAREEVEILDVRRESLID